MTQDEIIRMAREAGMTVFVIESLERFFNLAFAAGAAHEKKFWMEQIEVECNEAVLAEREACAKVCDKLKWHSAPNNFAENCAEAIRARSNK